MSEEHAIRHLSEETMESVLVHVDPYFRIEFHVLQTCRSTWATHIELIRHIEFGAAHTFIHLVNLKKQLNNENLLSKFGFDTAENFPSSTESIIHFVSKFGLI